ncbi:hypothetical protein [uncultured Zhongshania sp.]|uniref:hypothetical protein n=1 Tax=uncultured Zhongshania sp. TaxID=1642288 RepID=UPI0030D85760|tara:strand:+ start:1513 stop:2223 length:711 start_codon:yes stop_codon:yes gene_type:complete
MQNTSNYSDGRQFTAWAAIIAAIQAWACAGFYAAATGGDFGMVLRPAEFLALPTTAIDQFWLAMILDCLGFYLPFLIIGAYFWARLRPDHGVPMDMALLCIVVYVILGTAGAGIQFSTLHPLVVAHAAGDSMSQAASEKAWLAISHAAQGLWKLEGPVMGLWGVVVGRAIHRSGMPFGRLLMFVGLCYATAFVTSVLGLTVVFELVQLIFILLLPLWALLTGIHLLRNPSIGVTHE